MEVAQNTDFLLSVITGFAGLGLAIMTFYLRSINSGIARIHSRIDHIEGTTQNHEVRISVIENRL